MNRLSLGTNLSIGDFWIMRQLTEIAQLWSWVTSWRPFNLLLKQVLWPPFEHSSPHMSISGSFLVGLCGVVFVHFDKIQKGPRIVRVQERSTARQIVMLDIVTGSLVPKRHRRVILWRILTIPSSVTTRHNSCRSVFFNKAKAARGSDNFAYCYRRLCKNGQKTPPGVDERFWTLLRTKKSWMTSTYAFWLQLVLKYCWMRRF